MAFTRDDLAAYEQQPQTQVAEKPIVTAPAATEPEPSQAEPAESAESSAAGESDQAELGGATSDDNSTESSTEGADADAETAEGETEGAEPTEGETESTDQKPQKQSRAFKRIQELNAKALEASDLAEGYKEFGKLTAEQLKAAREELAELRAKLGGDKPTTASEQPTPSAVAKLGPMPKLTDPDVNFDPDVLAQKVEEWTEKKVELSVKAALQKTGEQTQAEKTVATFQARIEDFKKVATDWDTKVKNPELPKLNPAAQSVLVKSELGPQMVYHLASNIAEAKRIAALLPEDQVMEIGVLKATLASAAKSKPTTTAATPVTSAKPVAKKSVSQAPPPPTPVPAGRRANAREETDPGMDMDEFARRHRESKNNARLAARKMRGLN